MKLPTLIKEAAVRVVRIVRAIDPADALTVAGIACIGAGAWQISPAVGLIVVGLALLYLGLWHGALVVRLLGRVR